MSQCVFFCLYTSIIEKEETFFNSFEEASTTFIAKQKEKIL